MNMKPLFNESLPHPSPVSSDYLRVCDQALLVLDLFKHPQLGKKLLPSLLLLGQFEGNGTLQFVFSLPKPLILLLQLEYKVVAKLLCIQFFNNCTVWVGRGLVVRSAQKARFMGRKLLPFDMGSGVRNTIVT